MLSAHSGSSSDGGGGTAAAAQAAQVEHGLPVDAFASLTRLQLDTLRLQTDFWTAGPHSRPRACATSTCTRLRVMSLSLYQQAVWCSAACSS